MADKNTITPELLKDRVLKIEELADALKKDVLNVIVESDEKTFDSWKGEEADMFRTKEDAVTDALKEDLDKTVKLAEQMRYLLSKSERA
ncbi:MULTISPECIES: hypothetical protein [Butyrivibrio]|jgi:hypothetical protein|uniref:WXG100 family type VII secretion target n=1 Tax=Butyrivibrio fibrisolvens TaxID=831 RepID=A0A1H9LCN6_BUTFI|nr:MULTISPECIES: hypothetical protein [Butyrivibrio]MBQ1457355.1 hypothetical protein [Butyrivibrio sp.]MCR4637475.1 hypothetical protein [Butyrivibrio sp.]PWT28637.1 hypothetical protein CPT75_16725 [Butyrivibrio fibrisolvens]SEP82608.1 hypothetical protein SAMN02910382_01139 [Butyrivibrio sp. TB]SER08947.1 hypothetical protein SAMN04487884_10219 [Butyrivibrio fibrisolvens]